MAMIKCSECSKQVSDKANTCPACGNPIGGSSSTIANAFECRIEQYKKALYTTRSRSDNSIVMACYNKNCTNFSINQTLLITFFITFMLFICLLFSESWFYLYISNGAKTIIGIILIGISILSLIFYFKASKVIITLTKTGKIEETGNVIKKK